jgi:hypothetical protein
LLKENSHFKSEVDTFRNKFGSLDQIASKLKIADLKESKVSDLVENLSTNLSSTETQLSCYKCSNLLSEPLVQVPCAHVVCRKCMKQHEASKCGQCNTAVKGQVWCSLIEDLVNKYTINKDYLEAFKNDKTWLK